MVLSPQEAADAYQNAVEAADQAYTAAKANNTLGYLNFISQGNAARASASLSPANAVDAFLSASFAFEVAKRVANDDKQEDKPDTVLTADLITIYSDQALMLAALLQLIPPNPITTDLAFDLKVFGDTGALASVSFNNANLILNAYQFLLNNGKLLGTSLENLGTAIEKNFTSFLTGASIDDTTLTAANDNEAGAGLWLRRVA